MNVKSFPSVFAALSLAMVGSVAMAGEASPAPVPASTLSRAEVQAAAADARQLSRGEASVFVDTPAAAPRDREEVREEARAAARKHAFDPLQAG